MSTYYPQDDNYQFVDFETMQLQAYRQQDNEQENRARHDQQDYAERQLADLRSQDWRF
jgi:hypothetical protein